MRKLLLIAAMIIASMGAKAQSVPEPTQEIHIWPNGAPTSNGLSGEEKEYGDHVSNVTDPILWVYQAKNPNGLAVLACPGGGYVDVWYLHEGKMMADFYNEMGVTLAVLKYRLPNGNKEVPLDDVQQAMHILRSHSNDWNIKKLGIQGCSAGGHLAAMASTHYTNAENRPDFQILFYPVITLDPSFTHMGSHEFLLGKKASKKTIAEFSNEKCVTPNTPPALILTSSDDDLVPIKNSIEYFNALKANGVKASMHLYPEGGHGWGWRDGFKYKKQAGEEIRLWIEGMR